MSKEEREELSRRLQEGLKESFYKMLALKEKLGQPIVTSDENGEVMILSAQEAREYIKLQHQKDQTNSDQIL